MTMICILQLLMLIFKDGQNKKYLHWSLMNFGFLLSCVLYQPFLSDISEDSYTLHKLCNAYAITKSCCCCWMLYSHILKCTQKNLLWISFLINSPTHTQNSFFLSFKQRSTYLKSKNKQTKTKKLGEIVTYVDVEHSFSILLDCTCSKDENYFADKCA